MGIIDTLTAGFNTVVKNLWLVSVPVALDVALWLGPKLSVAPVVERLTSTMSTAMQSLDPAATAGMNLTELAGSLSTLLKESVGRLNLFSLLAWGRLGMPSVASLRQIQPGVDRVIEVSGYGQWLGIQFGLLLIGLLVCCLFLGMLGQAARGEGLQAGKLVKRLPTYWLYLLVFVVPLGALVVSAVWSSLLLGALVFLFWGLLLWVVLYTVFVPEAITMGEDKPLRALASSFAVVRSAFWPTLGLIILVNVINLGLGMLWPRLLATPVGTAAAILLNAFVGTSLTAAYFVYYRERMSALYAAANAQRKA